MKTQNQGKYNRLNSNLYLSSLTNSYQWFPPIRYGGSQLDPISRNYSLFMSEEESGQNQEQLPKTKQEAQRKFGCPCGKWYLSYPALFTHVKQKHQGKPPGQLIKPKTDKTRGRPRLPTNNNEEENSIANYDCVEELEKAIMNKTIQYDQPFDSSEGNETCQDMATHFLRIMGGTGEDKKILTCFLNYLRFTVKRKYDETYWETKRPSEIIDLSNDIVKEIDTYHEQFPLEKETLIDLLFVLFRWMYKNKWTDHKLLKRSSSEQQAPKV